MNKEQVVKIRTTNTDRASTTCEAGEVLQVGVGALGRRVPARAPTGSCHHSLTDRRLMVLPLHHYEVPGPLEPQRPYCHSVISFPGWPLALVGSPEVSPVRGRHGLHPRQSTSGAPASLQPVVTHPVMGHRLLRPQPGTLQALGPSSPTCCVPGTLRCHVQPTESAGMLAGQALGSW